MQMTEDLIRNVVQEVLSQMGSGVIAGNGRAGAHPAGNLGVFPTVEAAALAAAAAFEQFRRRSLADRKKAVECIRRICVDSAEELGRAELDETRIGRLDHKIAKLKETIPLIPGVEYLRTENASGDLGLTLTDYSPFGVIGAITPVTHSLPTLAANAINMLAAGNTVVFNAHPAGGKVAALGVRRFNTAIREATGLENLLTIIDPPTLKTAAQLFDHPAIKLLVVQGARQSPALRWPASGGPSWPDREIHRSSSMARPAWKTRPSRSSWVAHSTTTCFASARSRSSRWPRSSTHSPRQ